MNLSRGAAAFFAGTLCLSMLLSCGRSKPDPVQLDQRIRQELPVGTSKAAVVTFLERHRLQHYDSSEDRNYAGPPKVWGILSERHGLITMKFIYSFEFDSHDVLTSYAMNNGFVGP